MKDITIANLKETRRLIRRYRRLENFLRQQKKIEFDCQQNIELLNDMTGYGSISTCILCQPCTPSFSSYPCCNKCIHILSPFSTVYIGREQQYPCTYDESWVALEAARDSRELAKAINARIAHLEKLLKIAKE